MGSRDQGLGVVHVGFRVWDLRYIGFVSILLRAYMGVKLGRP